MKITRAALIVLTVFIADQISKWWIVETMIKPLTLPPEADASAMPFLQWLISAQEQMPFARIEIMPFFNLVMVWNKGVSFGLFNDHGDYGPLILTILAGVIAVIFSAWLVRSKNPIISLSLALIIGGALGNMVDRIRFRAVADFLDFHFLGAHWPAFNVADSAITVGIAILLIHSLFFDKKPKEASAS